jgi:hypothetical protein
VFPWWFSISSSLKAAGTGEKLAMASGASTNGCGSRPASARSISAALGAAGQPAAEVLDRFITGLGLPRRLRDVGVKREDLQRADALRCVPEDGPKDEDVVDWSTGRVGHCVGTFPVQN